MHSEVLLPAVRIDPVVIIKKVRDQFEMGNIKIKVQNLVLQLTGLLRRLPFPSPRLLPLPLEIFRESGKQNPHFGRKSKVYLAGERKLGHILSLHRTPDCREFSGTPVALLRDCREF